MATWLRSETVATATTRTSTQSTGSPPRVASTTAPAGLVSTSTLSRDVRTRTVRTGAIDRSSTTGRTPTRRSARGSGKLTRSHCSRALPLSEDTHRVRMLPSKAACGPAWGTTAP